jgi:hypothetical protein
MKKAASLGSVDFSILSNGQAIATLAPVDAAGLETTLPEGTSVPAWTASDPGVVISVSEDGLQALVTPSQPPVLVQDCKLTVTATLPDSTVITGESENIDIIAGGPAGFKIKMS